jgi:hypothetical protein
MESTSLDKEEFRRQLPLWFARGRHDTGEVDIEDGRNVIMTRVPADVARQIIQARSSYVVALSSALGIYEPPSGITNNSG